jgi:(2R)-3-sulfolactate dehydrogenase (NADP+)
MASTRLSTEEARQLVIDALVAHATHPDTAACVASALLAAEIDGQPGHGLSRVPAYAAQASSGKVDGFAVPLATAVGEASWRVDAGRGFAFPALDLAIGRLAASVPGKAIGIATVYRSHHAGQAGLHVERLAERGLIGLFFGNSPKAIAPWGGRQPLFGTNPIAFATPRREASPLVIDTSLSRAARGKIQLAARRGEPIPEGWALDAAGAPTTDSQAALAGSMLPMGEAKGAALVLMVEILSAALTGAHFGFEASSFFEKDGPPPEVGQTLIAIDPGSMAGDNFSDRLETLLSAVLDQHGTRLPGAGKPERRKRAARDGIEIPCTRHVELLALSSPEVATDGESRAESSSHG